MKENTKFIYRSISLKIIQKSGTTVFNTKRKGDRDYGTFT